MATLSDLALETVAELITFEDDTTPAGHFGAMAVIVDTTIIYLLEGEKNASDAAIKGRVELNGENGTVWIGGQVLNGEYIGEAESFAASFAAMV